MEEIKKQIENINRRKIWLKDQLILEQNQMAKWEIRYEIARFEIIEIKLEMQLEGEQKI